MYLDNNNSKCPRVKKIEVDKDEKEYTDKGPAVVFLN
jgi:hypothetical protein